MNTYYEVKYRYQKMNDNGVLKTVTETYIVDAVSFTETEKRIVEQMQSYVSGDAEVRAIKLTKYAEIVAGIEGDLYFCCKIALVTLDEKTAKEKRTPMQLLIKAKDLDAAKKELQSHMDGTMSDWEMKSISETKILDYFAYDK